LADLAASRASLATTRDGAPATGATSRAANGHATDASAQVTSPDVP